MPGNRTDGFLMALVLGQPFVGSAHIPIGVASAHATIGIRGLHKGLFQVPVYIGSLVPPYLNGSPSVIGNGKIPQCGN
jgi:hypothetical protein